MARYSDYVLKAKLKQVPETPEIRAARARRGTALLWPNLPAPSGIDHSATSTAYKRERQVVKKMRRDLRVAARRAAAS